MRQRQKRIKPDPVSPQPMLNSQDHKEPDLEVAGLKKGVRKQAFKSVGNFLKFCILLLEASSVAVVIHYTVIFFGWAFGLPTWSAWIEGQGLGVLVFLVVAASLFNYFRATRDAENEDNEKSE